MADLSALITAIATLLAAMAWPAAAFCIVWLFRKEIRLIIAKLPALFDRMKSVKVFEFEAQLEKVADQATSGGDTSGTISPSEIIVADQIKDDVDEIGEQAIASQLDKLCIEYDTIRRTMEPSRQRTHSLTKILVRMRMLGPSMSKYITNYMTSGSPGSRLAAVAMMQIEPQKANLEWLLRRFKEDAPFIFYHSALALQNVANNVPDKLAQVKMVAAIALNIVKNFNGEPDGETIFVLEALLEDRDSGHYV